jgi:peptidyl-prolyl cis-trans isomerase C
MRNKLLFSLTILCLCACGQSGDEGQPGADDETVVLVEVDGEPITLSMLERMMEARGVGEADHERMRQLLDELIRMQVVATAADEAGVDEAPEVRAELRLAEVQTLYRNYINRVQRDSPITDQQIRAAYQAQLERSGDTQYRIEFVRFDEQSAALAAIERLEEGAALDELEAAGEVESPGWIDRSQVPKPFAARLAETGPGEIVPVPLQSGQGWHAVRVVETRPLDPPPFEQVKEGIARTLLRQQRESFVESLYQDANIEPMLPLEEAE